MFAEPTQAKTGRPQTLPLRKLKVGEDFFWAGRTADQVARRYYDLKPMRFRSRTVIVNGVVGSRVWRLA